MDPLLKKVKENVVTSVLVAIILAGLSLSYNAVKGFIQQPARNKAKADSILVLYKDLNTKYDVILKENEELKENMDRLLDVIIKD